MSAWASGDTLERLKLKPETAPSNRGNGRQASADATSSTSVKATSNADAEGVVQASMAATIASTNKNKNKKALEGKVSKKNAPKNTAHTADEKQPPTQEQTASSSGGAKRNEPKKGASDSRDCPVTLPSDVAELVVNAFTFIGTVQALRAGTSTDGRESMLSAAVRAPEFVPQRRDYAVQNATSGSDTQHVGELASNAYPMHHHHHHHHYQLHQQQKQPQHTPLVSTSRVQQQEQPPWAPYYNDQQHRQHHSVHHHRHQQQQQQLAYGQPDCTTGKMYHDAYSPVDYDMNLCAAPPYSRMYSGYPGMCMGANMLPNMSGYGGLALRRPLPYFPQQQNQVTAYKSTHVGQQQPWMRNDSGPSNARKGSGAGQWYPGGQAGFNDALSVWNQQRNAGNWAMQAEQSGPAGAHTSSAP
ncbi:uncharacterized protein TEOVI_000263600 [Trypanosoma equiperdum]|uniref:Uncharacterized protein n=1 Tax=Trypanosoma equiperdum TaxID=5694 RepID=A0A1G4IFV1_TRYEQ|nr:hypothetical protein, conserved [Trypanosoma equiperdum]